jgi:hypothetical protein
VWGLTVSTAAALGWLLVGAPWTSLEWTRGLSLRYMLPFAVALPCLSAIGLLPSSLPWYKRTLPAVLAGAAAAAAVGTGTVSAMTTAVSRLSGCCCIGWQPTADKSKSGKNQ